MTTGPIRNMLLKSSSVDNNGQLIRSTEHSVAYMTASSTSIHRSNSPIVHISLRNETWEQWSSCLRAQRKWKSE